MVVISPKICWFKHWRGEQSMKVFKRWWLILIAWWHRRCCVCGGQSVWPFWLLVRTRQYHPVYNFKKADMSCHGGNCQKRFECGVEPAEDFWSWWSGISARSAVFAARAYLAAMSIARVIAVPNTILPAQRCLCTNGIAWRNFMIAPVWPEKMRGLGSEAGRAGSITTNCPGGFWEARIASLFLFVRFF